MLSVISIIGDSRDSITEREKRVELLYQSKWKEVTVLDKGTVEWMQ